MPLIACIIADTDSHPDALESDRCDLLISLGDIGEATIQWYQRHLGHPRTLAVRGNHDPEWAFEAGIEDLHLRTAEAGGIVFGGFKGSWEYKRNGNNMYIQEMATELLTGLPAVDVMIAHNSPKGIHERDDHVHQGFEGLLVYAIKHRPSMILHGHQHVNSETMLGRTRVIGVFGHRFLTIEKPGTRP